MKTPSTWPNPPGLRRLEPFSAGLRGLIGFLDEMTRAIVGRSYAEPDILIKQLAQDEATAEADTLLLTVPNQLGVDFNAQMIEAILIPIAPALDRRPLPPQVCAGKCSVKQVRPVGALSTLTLP